MEPILTWYTFGTFNSEAPAILMLHGFMGCGSDWQPVAESLSLTCRCLCPDLPGHGALRHDTANAAAGMPEISAALLKGLDAHGIDQCALVGYSMGGRLALYLAVRYPKRFSCLVLESASPGLRTTEERRQRKIRDEVLEERLTAMQEGSPSFKAFLHEWYQQPLFSTLSQPPVGTVRLGEVPRELLGMLVCRRLENHPPSLAAALRSTSIASQPGLWEELPRLTLPTLIITGAADEKYCGLGVEMKTLMQCATLERIEGCSHAPHLERPDLYAITLNRFFRKYRRIGKEAL